MGVNFMKRHLLVIALLGLGVASANAQTGATGATGATVKESSGFTKVDKARERINKNVLKPADDSHYFVKKIDPLNAGKNIPTPTAKVQTQPLITKQAPPANRGIDRIVVPSPYTTPAVTRPAVSTAPAATAPARPAPAAAAPAPAPAAPAAAAAAPAPAKK
jgi:hypothetical protein